MAILCGQLHTKGWTIDLVQFDIESNFKENALDSNLCKYFDTSNYFVNRRLSKHVMENKKLLTRIKNGKDTTPMINPGIAHM
jgi:hypothetical protein